MDSQNLYPPQPQQPFSNQQPPKKTNNTVLYVVIGCGCFSVGFVIFTIISIIVLIQLGRQQTKVFSDINEQLQKAQQQQQQDNH
jgi:uncharacterized membrane protein